LIEIEKYSCNDSNEAKARERYWYEQLNANLNSVCPIRTKDENKMINNQLVKKYYLSNIDKMLEYHKQYYEKNREFLTKTINCECGGKYSHPNKKRHLNCKNIYNIKQKIYQYNLNLKII